MSCEDEDQASHGVLPAWAQPFLSLLEIDVETPFFVVSDNAGQKILKLTSKAMSGKQRSTDGDMLILVVLSQNVRPPYSQLLDHGLQMSNRCCMVIIHLTGQFLKYLMGIRVD
jgi:hypothetical protein